MDKILSIILEILVLNLLEVILIIRIEATLYIIQMTRCSYWQPRLYIFNNKSGHTNQT